MKIGHHVRFKEKEMFAEELVWMLLFILGFHVYIMLAAIFIIRRYNKIDWDMVNKLINNGPPC